MGAEEQAVPDWGKPINETCICYVDYIRSTMILVDAQCHTTYHSMIEQLLVIMLYLLHTYLCED